MFFVQDLKNVGAFTAAARKAITEDARASAINVVVCVGASFQMRVIMTMIEKTGRLMKRKMAEVRFAANLDEARQVVAAERAKMMERNG